MSSNTKATKAVSGIQVGLLCKLEGRSRNNIEDDLAQEISNRLSKNVVQRMGPSKSISSISKVSKAMCGITSIKVQFDKTIKVEKVLVQHATRDSLKDEKEVVEYIIKLNPFHHIEGRSHEHFSDIKRLPLRYLNVVDFHKWLEKPKRKYIIKKTLEYNITAIPVKTLATLSDISSFFLAYCI